MPQNLNDPNWSAKMYNFWSFQVIWRVFPAWKRFGWCRPLFSRKLLFSFSEKKTCLRVLNRWKKLKLIDLTCIGLLSNIFELMYCQAEDQESLSIITGISCEEFESAIHSKWAHLHQWRLLLIIGVYVAVF